MNSWFTSDLHLGHRFVARLRGMDVVQHDRQILAGIRALPPGDRLWVLGDLSRGSAEEEERALNLLAEHGAHLDMHLIAGNHDSCHPIHKSAFKMQRHFLGVFSSVAPFQKLRWEGRTVYLSHFPRPGYDHEGMESRHDDVRLDVDHLVHGHLHSSQALVAPGMVDVGVDAWDLRPARQQDVAALLFQQ
ncbi:Calcineurin-like phosphoesterase superfamily domain protein [Corynebacterium atrinae]|uniref:metallophosphoesterase n=1 Tax=Corynebacterium atrinae TaxID=1336740 RepID=UPI0025B30366|nr:metallophosphoesterase [Corynebacterium atrinae]WJY63974.1 Calcineurin-like phosphoesterase superfamily domain protein [Corynebacterium atrinae]